MKPIFGRIYPTPDNPKRGDCWSACLASILELDLDDVPYFMDDLDTWFSKTQEWLAPRGLALVEVTFVDAPTLSPLPDGMLVICSGPSKTNPGLNHSVIMRTSNNGKGFDWVHDPNPASEFLDHVADIAFLVPYDPARIASS